MLIELYLNLTMFTDHIQRLASGNNNGDQIVMIFMICLYFLIRDNLANVVMAKSYKFLFRVYALFTEVAKNVAILSAFISILMTYQDGNKIYPITVALLWLRFFISYIEVNVNIATFILSIGEVSYFNAKLSNYSPVAT